MKIFILEDDPRRISQFQDKLWREGRVIYVANTVAQAIELATKEGPFDVLFLDHDLAPEHYPDFDPSTQNGDHLKERTPTGYDFVLWMIENSSKVVEDYCQIFIHSMNPVGSRKMADAIYASSIDCVPTVMSFGSLITRM